jgi:perosamine synthetase
MTQYNKFLTKYARVDTDKRKSIVNTRMIKRYRLNIPTECLNEVVETLKSGNLAIGKSVNNIEHALANFLKCNYVVSTTNGFSALHLAIEVTIGRSAKEVLIPSCSTCFSTVNAVVASGNIPVFYDISIDGFGVNFESLKNRLTRNTVAIIYVPHFGIPDNIKKLNNEFNLPVIVDAAQSIFIAKEGFFSKNIAIYSSYPTKGLVGIDGGFIACQDKEVYNALKKLRYYGKQKNIDGCGRYNYKLNNINATVALWYLENLNSIIYRRQSIQNRYIEVIKEYSSLLAWCFTSKLIVLQKYVLLFKEPNQATKYLRYMNDQGIESSYEMISFDKDRNMYPNSNFVDKCLVSVPLYEDLTNVEVDYICEKLNKILKDIYMTSIS